MRTITGQTERVYAGRYPNGTPPAGAAVARTHHPDLGDPSTRFCTTAQATCEVAGAFGNDTLYGEAGDDGIWGQDGNDTILGGADDLYGELGDDTVLGQDGEDTILGVAEQATATAPDALAQLTAQQREIITLAARGLTTAEIGDRLFLSPRTVASHLYRSYPKLGIAGRHQLHDLTTPER